MPWRKWLVRGFVYSVLSGGLLAFLLYHFWTSPATVRRQVLAKLADRFPGASVTLDSAHLRILGGIAVTELRMARRNDLEKTDFLYVPSAIIYHDKEQMLDGILAIRKVEVLRPRLRVVRERDGRLNLSGLTALSRPEREPLPTLVVQQGTILFEDRTLSSSPPLLEIKDISLTMVNDPLPALTIEGAGRTDVLGPVHIAGRLRRDTGEARFDVELTSVPIGPTLVERLKPVCPQTAAHLRLFRAEGAVRATIAYRPASSPALAFDVRAKLHRGELSHARLPLPLEGLEGELHLVNAPAGAAACPLPATPCAPAVCCAEVMRISADRITAHSGNMSLVLAFKDLCIPCSAPEPDEAGMCLDDLTHELTWKMERVPVNKELLDNFPELKDIQRDYSPEGLATVTHKFWKDDRGAWHKSWHIVPEGMSARYLGFPYLLEKLTGSVTYELTSDHDHTCVVNLVGESAGRKISVTGRTRGDGVRPSEVALRIRGDSIPLDEKLRRALQGVSRTTFDQFHPQGLADIDITIARALGAQRFSNRYLIHAYNAAFSYDLFPYLLKNVSGDLEILPDHWEARNFRGTHLDGEMRFSGRSFPPQADGRPAPRMRVEIHGKGIALDEQFKGALAPPGIPERSQLKSAWQTLGLSGRMGFDAEVTDLGATVPNLDVQVAAHGCSMRPQFFKYDLDDVAATVHYSPGGITFSKLQARHGAAALSIATGQVLPKSSGGFQVRIGIPDKPRTGIVVRGMTADADLLSALREHERLFKGLEAVNLRGPFDLTTEMVIDPQDDGKNLIWWDGNMEVHNATLRAGVDLTGVEGTAACCGLYKNDSVRAVIGNIDFKEASLLGQPLHRLHTNFTIKDDSPELLRFYNIGAELFGGQIGGQAHIDFTGPPRFELNLVGLQLKLEQFGRFNELGPGAELEGMAELSLLLKGKADDVCSLSGDGLVDVPNGKLYRLPPLLDLLKALGLRAPDRTAFERARLEFNVEGDQVKVNKLNLIGSAVSLRGQGTVRIDGSDLSLDFNADPGMIPQIVPLLSWIQQTVSDQLLKIKVRGSLTQPRFEKELVPGVVDPVKRLMGTR
jgi:hypothetical protein